MATYLISYDLVQSKQNYCALYREIKAISHIWWHNLDSTWIIKHSGPAEEILRSLKPYLHPRDKLLVVKLSDEAAGIGFRSRATDWVKINLQ